MKNKTKEHRFTLVVKTSQTRRAAELAVLSAFALRKPDNCEFHLKRHSGDKEAYMAGTRAGTQRAIQIVNRELGHKLLKKIGKTICARDKTSKP